MKKLVSTKGLPKKEWLRYRKHGICGTDAGAICGLNPYRSAAQVFMDKLSDEVDEVDNESMRQGRDLEEYVVQRFTQETGLKARRANAIYYNEQHPHMLADFDRLIVGQRAGLECKTVSPYNANKWDDGKIPIHYQMQVQHYLAVSGFDCWYIAALILGTGFVIRRIDRDEELIRYLIAIEEHFWKNNVIGRIMPDPDGSNGYSEILKKQYSGNRREQEVQLFGVEDDLRRRDEIKELLDKLEKDKRCIEQRIQLRLGEMDASYGTAGEYRISYVPVVTQRIDTGKLKKEQPELYARYLKESQGMHFMVKKVQQDNMAA